jgi:predicted metal-dependent phosphoesterase TrpH
VTSEPNSLMWTIELHCHTYYSEDSLNEPGRLLEVCRKRGIDRLAITDHNAVLGARAAAALDPERIISGEEIMTTRGELLAFFVGELVPAGLTPEAAIRRLRDQGAFISVSHPFDSVRKGAWNPEDLEAILDQVDALEVFNARVLSNEPNRRAEQLAQRVSLPGTSGSDAHTYAEVGRAAMQLPPFSDADSLRRALHAARILRRRSSPLVHLASRYASWRKRLGWRPPM